MSGSARETVPGGASGPAVEALVERLVAAAGAELAAYHRYTLVRMDTVPELARLLDDVRAEDRIHYETLVERIHQLGARPATEFLAFTGTGPYDADPLTDLVATKRAAVRAYTIVCAATEGRDPWTFELSSAILREEIEHESWIREFLGEAEQSRFRHGFRGRSPYVRPVTPSATRGD